MYYSEFYFGKDIAALTYDDIEKYFETEQVESDKIEFKSYKPGGNANQKEDAIIECICGMLNSEGGLIIWGAPGGINLSGNKEKIFKGALCPVEQLYEKDAFVSKITNKITPSPRGIKFQRLENNGKYTYVFDIEKSMYSPHQFGSYYPMRIDGQTRPAPHHYIEALFHQITYPKLEGYVRIDKYIDHEIPQGPYSLKKSERYFEISVYIFNRSIFQHEHKLYYKILLYGATLNGYEFNKSTFESYSNDGKKIQVQDAKDTLYYNEALERTFRLNINGESDYIRIHFFFAGKKSPLILSEYEIKIPGETIVNDCKSLIIWENENEPLYEKKHRDGKSLSDIQDDLINE